MHFRHLSSSSPEVFYKCVKRYKDVAEHAQLSSAHFSVKKKTSSSLPFSAVESKLNVDQVSFHFKSTVLRQLTERWRLQPSGPIQGVQVEGSCLLSMNYFTVMEEMTS